MHENVTDHDPPMGTHAAGGSPWRQAAKGCAAGVVATTAMSAFMVGAQRLGLMSELPPERIARKVVDPLVDGRPRGASLDLATAVIHFGVGASAGGAYGLLSTDPRVRSLPALVRGVVFGTVLWAAAYGGALPAVGLMPRPARDERPRPLVMLVAHWVYGITLAALLARGDGGTKQ